MKETMRMCISCRTRKDKREMIRVVKTPQGNVEVDESGKKSGRGAYVCSEACLQKCIKAKLLNRAFKSEVKSEVYGSLSKASGIRGEEKHHE